MKKFFTPVLTLAMLFPTMANVFAAPYQPITVQSVEFESMDFPKSNADFPKNPAGKDVAFSQAKVKVTYSDGSTKTLPLHYEVLFTSGDQINGKTVGVSYDVYGNPLKSKNGNVLVSGSNDSNSLLQVPGAPATSLGGHPLYMVTHFESIGDSTFGYSPRSVQLSTIDQNKTSGQLSVTDITYVDFSKVKGIWTPCAGSLTPWNTHLGSEEYEPNARNYEEGGGDRAKVDQFVKNLYQDPNAVGSPYNYGVVPEITVHADGTTSVVKHYSMGRLSFEQALVLPDKRTVYYGDDGGYKVMFMYVADRPEDLSEGTLYAAKWNQTGTENGGSANLEWIKLGHANDAEIEQYANTLKFSDIFELAPAGMDTVTAQTYGYTAIKTNGLELLKVKPGMDKAAAFLESRRYAAIKGATYEFNKMEGVAFNQRDNKLYMAMSGVTGSMLANTADPADHIRLPKVDAGAIYEIGMSANQKTVDGETIDSPYVATTMSGIVLGQDIPRDQYGNTADPDKIANPDNVAYSEKMRTLFIAEDSGQHKYDTLWAYNVDTKKLSRLLTVPSGEVTGLQMVEDMNGFTYLMLANQGPGTTGYLAGLPSLTQPYAGAHMTINGPQNVYTNGEFALDVDLNQVRALYGASVKLQFDPSKLEVVDQDPATTDKVEIKAGTMIKGHVIKNEADNQQGLISFAVTELGETAGTDGEGTLANVKFRVKPGATGPIEIKPVGTVQFANNQNEKIDVHMTSFTSTITVPTAHVKGSIKLPNSHHLNDKSAFTVRLMKGEQTVSQTTTNADGSFTLPSAETGTYRLVISKDGYKKAIVSNLVIQSAGELTIQDPITMYVGDFNQDDLINLEDITSMARVYEKAAAEHALYDVDKKNELIDLSDIVTVARNFLK